MLEDTKYQNKNGLFYSFWDENRRYHPHFHSQIELNYMMYGSYIVTLDQRTFRVEAGDLLTVFPNQVHSFDSPEEHRALVMIFSLKLFSEFEDYFENNIPHNPVIRAKDMPKGLVDDLLQLHDRFCGKKDASEFTDVPLDIYQTISAEMFVKGIALKILSAITEKMRFDVAQRENIDILRRFVIYCNKNFAQEMSLSEVAENLSVNKSYISHLITNKLHTTYSRYINDIRINEACRKLINTSLPITEIAFSVGYASIRTFNRAFLGLVGVSPSNYRMSHMSQEE